MDTGFKTFSDVISFAVMREEEAHAFYLDLAQKTTDHFISQIFKEFAIEELKHKKMLLDMDLKGIKKMFESMMEKLDDLQLAEHFHPVEADPEMDFKEALVLAMKREEKSANLYSFLAEAVRDDDVSLLFISMAKEEERHKLQIEKTFNDIFSPR